LLPSSPGGLKGSWPYRTYPTQRYVFCIKKQSYIEKNSNFAISENNNMQNQNQDNKTNKIIKVNIFQTSMTLGTYLGLYLTLVNLTFVLALKFSLFNLLFIPLFLGIPVAAYFIQKIFRDRNNLKFFPIPVSWIIALLTFIFATVLSCVIAFLYLQFLDNGALATGIMAKFETIKAAGLTNVTDPQMIETYNNSISNMEQNIKWFYSLTPLEMTKLLIQSCFMWGNLISLFVGLITSRNRIRNLLK